MNAPPDAVVMPRLPAVAPRVAPEPPPAPVPVAPAAAPTTEAVPKQPSRRPRRALRWIFTAICSLIALGLFAVGVLGAYLIATGAEGATDARALPTFSVAPPAYGTVDVLVETSGAEPETYRVTANGDATVRYYTYAADSPTNAGALGVMDPAGLYFLAPGEATWSLISRSPTELLAAQTFMSKVLTFDDCVPATARPYTEVLDHTETTIAGRVLQRYELRMEIGRWHSNKPSAFDAWEFAGGNTPENDELMDFTIFVDQSGLVWQFEIGDSEGSLTVTLQSFSPEVFAPQMPLVYLDMTNGGVLVGG